MNSLILPPKILPEPLCFGGIFFRMLRKVVATKFLLYCYLVLYDVVSEDCSDTHSSHIAHFVAACFSGIIDDV